MDKELKETFFFSQRSILRQERRNRLCNELTVNHCMEKLQFPKTSLRTSSICCSQSKERMLKGRKDMSPGQSANQILENSKLKQHVLMETFFSNASYISSQYSLANEWVRCNCPLSRISESLIGVSIGLMHRYFHPKSLQKWMSKSQIKYTLQKNNYSKKQNNFQGNTSPAFK